jgi:hypothetical protein
VFEHHSAARASPSALLTATRSSTGLIATRASARSSVDLPHAGLP